MPPFEKWKRDLFRALEAHRFATNSQRTSTEYYICGFATVQVSVSPESVEIERYYDNELIDLDRHFHRSIPMPRDAFPDAAAIVTQALSLKSSIRSDEPILNFAA